MTDSQTKQETTPLRTGIRSYLRHHSRALRAELVVLVALFLFVEFAVPLMLSSGRSKRFFEKHLSDALKYPVTFERINTRLFGRAVVEVAGLKILDHQGQPFFHADDARLELNLWSLLRGRISLSRIQATDGDFLAARLPDGRWNVADLIAAGNDPDRAIDLEKTAIDLRNVVVTFRDQAPALPLLKRIRLRDFSLSTLDVRRRMRLHVDAIDEDHPESSLAMNGNFSIFMPDDLSTLSGHLEVLLKHFNLDVLNPYLSAYRFPLNGCAGSYDLDLRADGRGASPLLLVISSRIEGLKIAVPSSGGRRIAESVASLRKPGAAWPDERTTWIDLGEAFLAGPINLWAGKAQFQKLHGQAAKTQFELSGEVSQLHSDSPRVEASLATRDFELVEPVRSLINLSLDQFSRQIFSGVSGWAQADLKWTGKLTNPTLDWRSELKRAHYHDATGRLELSDVSASLRSEGKGTEIESLRAKVFGAPLTVHGRVDENDRMDLSVAVNALPLTRFFPYLEHERSRGRMSFASWVDHVTNLTGQAQAKLRVVGSIDNPLITGNVQLQRSQFRLVGVATPFENMNGQVSFSKDRVEARPLSGFLGDSPFNLDATFAQKDLSILSMKLDSPRMNLRHYDELATARWIDPVILPGLGRVKEADGWAAIHLNYNPAVNAQGANAVSDATSSTAPDPAPGLFSKLNEEFQTLPEFSIQADKINAVLSGVALPIENFSGGLSSGAGNVELQHVQGFIGDSAFSIDGSVRHLNQPDEQWGINFQSTLDFPQWAELLSATWKGRFKARGGIPIGVTIRGTREHGLQVTGEADFPKNSNLLWANFIEKPDDSESHVSLKGTWKGNTFDLAEGKLTLDGLPLGLRGSVTFPEASPAQMAMTLSLPQFAPAMSLARFVKLPASGIRIRGGVVSGAITLTGKVSDPSWNSALRVADLSLGGMPWGTTNLTGDLTAGHEGVSARDFLAIVNNVPMRVTGALTLTGPHPHLNFDVANMNLDALVFALARMNIVAEGSTPTVAGPPLSINVTASSGNFFHQPIRRFSARGEWKDGILNLDPMEVQAGDSFCRAHVTWNSFTNRQDMEFEAHEVPMGPFLDEVLDLHLPVQGKLNVQANLTSRNPDPANLLGSFVGTAHFDASNGLLEHSGLPQRLLSMAVLVHEGLFGFNLGRIFQTIDPPRFRSFKKFSADVDFLPQGKAHLKNGEFKSNLFNLNADGMVNTRSEDMNIVVKGSLPEIPRGSNFLAQIFGRISVKEFYRNAMDLSLLMVGQRKRIKPRRHNFEFKLTGNVEGIKSIDDFHFTR